MKSRITRMTAALLAAVLSLSLLVGCKPKKELTRYTTIFYDVFDTVTQVIAYCEPHCTGTHFFPFFIYLSKGMDERQTRNFR